MLGSTDLEEVVDIIEALIDEHPNYILPGRGKLTRAATFIDKISCGDWPVVRVSPSSKVYNGGDVDAQTKQSSGQSKPRIAP